MDESVEVGEIVVQYTAHGEEARQELHEFLQEVSEMVTSMEEPSAMMETHTFPEFDARLSWRESDQEAEE